MPENESGLIIMLPRILPISLHKKEKSSGMSGRGHGLIAYCPENLVRILTEKLLVQEDILSFQIQVRSTCMGQETITFLPATWRTWDRSRARLLFARPAQPGPGL